MPDNKLGAQRANTKGVLPQTKGIRKPGAARRTQSNATSSTALKQTRIPKAATGEKRQKVKIRKVSHKKKLKNRSNLPYLLLFVVFCVCVVFFSSFLSYTYLVDKYNNPTSIESIYIDPETEVKFKIERGATTKDIANNLKEMGLIRNTEVYRFLSKFNGYDGRYKAGTYTLSKGLSYDEIMIILTSYPESVKVTFPEGFTTEQIAQRLQANGVCSADEFLKAVQTIDLSSYPFIPDANGRDYRLDGYLFPDTYEFDVDANVNSVIYKMLNRFNEVFKPAYYDMAGNLGYTVDDIIKLASIIEKEVKVPSERITVSGVFHNRLKSSDPDMAYLQSCATVRYAYKKIYNETLDGDITEEHEKIQDPYNTYVAKGLPPGPICNPGLASIEAALKPEQHDYYYFVLRKDGSGGHIFSRTYEEHLKAKNS